MITPRQKDLLDFIKGFYSENGYCASYDEMAAAWGVNSRSTIRRLVCGLEERGFITRIPNRARCIEPTEKDSFGLGVLLPKLDILRDKKWKNSFKEEGRHFCILTGAPMPDGAHIRHGWFAAGLKPPDNRILPLAHHMHMKQHSIGELKFWIKHFDEIPEDLRMTAIEDVKNETDLEGTDGHIDLMDIVIKIAENYYKDKSR